MGWSQGRGRRLSFDGTALVESASLSKAASVVLAAARREKPYCDWLDACYREDPLLAVEEMEGNLGSPEERQRHRAR